VSENIRIARAGYDDAAANFKPLPLAVRDISSIEVL